MQLLQRQLHSLFSAAGTLPLSLDGTELTRALSGKGEFPTCIANHLSFTQGIPFCLVMLVDGRVGLCGFCSPCSAWPREQPRICRHGWDGSISGHSHRGEGKAKPGGVQHPGPCEGWKWRFIKERERKNISGFLNPPQQAGWGFLWVQTQRRSPLGKGSGCEELGRTPRQGKRLQEEKRIK